MKIINGFTSNNIAFNNNLNNKKYSIKANSYSQNTISKLGVYPKSYVSFGGGKSLNLQDTMQDIERSEISKKKSLIPQSLRSRVQQILADGNPENLRFRDVHYQVYAPISGMDTVEEIRDFLPEFSEIKTADEAGFRSDNFASFLKSGQHPLINSKKDLAVQFMDLYWARGLSMPDIVRYLNGASDVKCSISSVGNILSRLNIPIREISYARYLKLSDEEANKIITQLMSENRKGIVVSEAIRKAQSERMKKFYLENPERVFRVPSAYSSAAKENPGASLAARVAGVKAWKMGSCRPIIRDLSAFLSRREISGVDSAEQAVSVLQRLGHSKMMKEFWETYPQHKKALSRAFSHSWRKITERYSEETLNFLATKQFLPDKMIEEIKKYAKTKGYKVENLNFNLGLFIAGPSDVQGIKEVKLLEEYLNLPQNMQKKERLFILADFRRFLPTAKLKQKNNIYDLFDFYSSLVRACKNNTENCSKILAKWLELYEFTDQLRDIGPSLERRVFLIDCFHGIGKELEKLMRVI